MPDPAVTVVRDVDSAVEINHKTVETELPTDALPVLEMPAVVTKPELPDPDLHPWTS